MTRLPKTPLQDQADDNREQLIRYLLRQSEARQVMFLRSLSSDVSVQTGGRLPLLVEIGF